MNGRNANPSHSNVLQVGNLDYLAEVIEISDLKNVTMTGVGFPTIHGRLYDESDGGALVNAGGGTGIFSVSGGSKNIPMAYMYNQSYYWVNCSPLYLTLLVLHSAETYI